MAGEFDIRAACRNRVGYLREAVNMLKHKYPDVDVVVDGEQIGPCFYRTVFRTAVNNPEDHKEVALAIARTNEYMRDVKAMLSSYRVEHL